MGKSKPVNITEDSTFSLSVGNFWPFVAVIISFVGLYYGITNRLDLMAQKQDFYIRSQEKILERQDEHDKHIAAHDREITAIQTTLGIRSDKQSRIPEASGSAIASIPQSIIVENNISGQVVQSTPVPAPTTPPPVPTPTSRPGNGRVPGPLEILPTLIPTIIPLSISLIKK